MKWRKHRPFGFFFYWLCVLYPSSLGAQGVQPFFHHLSQDNKLTHGQNAYVFKDSRGFVWISSVNGLNRFDGQEVVPYFAEKGRANTLPSSFITGSFAEDGKGRVWFGTLEALCCWRPQTNDFASHRFQMPNGKGVRKDYYLFHHDWQGRFWVRADSTLLLFDPLTGRDSAIGILSGGDRLVVHEGKSTQVYQSFKQPNKGVDVYESTNDGKWTRRTLLPDCDTKYVLPENDSLVWVGTNRGLAALRPTTGQAVFYSTFRGKTLEVFDIEVWGNHTLLVSSTIGILVFDKKQKIFTNLWNERPGRKGRLRQTTVQELYIDPDSVLWASLWPIGLDYTQLRKARFPLLLDSEATGSRDNILSIVEDRQGQTWISTTQGFYVFDSNMRQKLQVPYQQLPPYKTFREGRLTLDSSGFVWLVTPHGIWKFNPINLYPQIVTIDHEHLLRSVSFLSKAPPVLLSYDDGLLQLEPNGQISTWNGLGDLDDHYVAKLWQDPNGQFLFAALDETTLAVYELKNGRWQLRRRFDDFARMLGMCPDGARNTWWMATTEGLARIQLSTRDTLQLLDPKDGIPGGTTYYSILRDPANGHLWLGGNNGLTRYDPNTQNSRNFPLHYGLQSAEFNQNAAWRDENGFLWMGGILGLHRFRPETTVAQQTAPPCRLIRCYVDDTLYAQGELEGMAFRQRNVTLSFVVHALDFSKEGPHKIRYQLLGYDTRAVETADNTPFRYANLPAGDYLLRVQGCDEEGNWATDALELPIQVRPPFWQHSWFWALCSGLLLAAAAFIWYRLRIRRIRREAEFQQRLAELETRALRAQLDSHFVFNALNAIKGYMVRNELRLAETYLDKFADLMRLILENTREMVVSLSSEMALLDNYLSISQLRLGYKFDYRFEGHEAKAIAETKIPSMVLQPYAENAVLHGLKNKRDGKGLFTVRCTLQEGRLHIVLEDNGIGRQKSAENQAKNAKTKRTSFGMDVTRRRIEAFGSNSSVRVEDLFDANGNARGTKIEIVLA